jgi:peptidoglycan/LPS O-acetylase OafA/YrhL
MVFAYHVGHVFDGSPNVGVMDEIASSAFVGISNGLGAVVAFFVISGFVLARSLDANPDATRFFHPSTS